MNVSIDTLELTTIYIHDWDGKEPEFLISPPESKSDARMKIGSVELVLFKKEGA